MADKNKYEYLHEKIEKKFFYDCFYKTFRSENHECNEYLLKLFKHVTGVTKLFETTQFLLIFTIEILELITSTNSIYHFIELNGG